jgi:threonine dehydrogenase-like Zn-dependent dehydrogenase
MVSPIQLSGRGYSLLILLNADRLLYVPSIIADGRLKSNPLLHHPGSLEAINDGLEQLKAGKTSAQKIVYTIV